MFHEFVCPYNLRIDGKQIWLDVCNGRYQIGMGTAVAVTKEQGTATTVSNGKHYALCNGLDNDFVKH